MNSRTTSPGGISKHGATPAPAWCDWTRFWRGQAQKRVARQGHALVHVSPQPESFLSLSTHAAQHIISLNTGGLEPIGG
jgi:hypothetical protein